MSPRTKLLIGVVLIILGVWWYAPGTVANVFLLEQSTLSNFQALVAMVQGGLGVLAVLIGIFVVWIELDELRLQREIEASQLDDIMEDSETEEHTCEECGRSFDSERGLHIHQSQVH